ncbi:MAG: SHOCT domain-containing protein [Caulobacteraceae bacterium]
MQDLTDQGRRVVEDTARRHNVSADAVATLLRALAAGHGTQAQFSHPELGGMGQWSRGGMTMIGDMFNNALKARVDAICSDLAEHMRGEALFAPAPSSTSLAGEGGGRASLFVSGSSGRWPADLGQPASAGSQNDMHYAVFPATRRLAIERGGQVSVYDTGDHRITGFSQQQGGGQSLTFTSQHGLVSLADLPLVTGAETQPIAPPKAATPEPPAPRPEASPSAPPPPKTAAPEDDIFAKIERLHDLHTRGILSAEEFGAKKAELLGRL